MRIKTKCLLSLVGLIIVDAVPFIPVIGLIGIHVILDRPPWFEDLVHRLYHDDDLATGETQ